MAFYTKDEARFLFFALFSCLPLYHCFRLARTSSPAVKKPDTPKIAKSQFKESQSKRKTKRNETPSTAIISPNKPQCQVQV